MDVSQVFEFPVKVHWQQPRCLIGAGASEMAAPQAAAMGLKHVLFVTSGLRGTGIVDDLKTQFEAAGVSVTVYDKVESNPKDYNVMDAYQAYVDAKCDGFVSIGGGSSTDTTKGARIVAAHDGRNTNEFQGANASETLANPPHIAINTTVGTGSETTPFYVITDTTSENAPHKWAAFDAASTTTLAINDPVLMMTQPPQYVAYTGFDTLAHASETYVGRVQMTSVLPEALRAIQLVEENLRQAYTDPHDFRAMSNMCWAQYMAAQAFSSGLLGILHSLSHAVCAYYDIHHGLNNGVGISRVWSFNQPARIREYADIAGAMHARRPGMSEVQASDAAIDAVVRLARDCGIPENFSSAGPYPKSRLGQGFYKDRPTTIASDDDELAKMGQHMVDDLCTSGNPRQLTHEAAVEILRDCVFEPMERGHGAPVDGRAEHRVADSTPTLADPQSYAAIITAAVQAQPAVAPAGR
jgi:methanol:N,N-dimethyl-4-nitrosoaniline oxidoreductase